MSDGGSATLDESLSVDGVMRSLVGRRVYFEKLHGNNGDDLIRMGALLAMEAAGLETIDSPDDADVIVINGGGGMIDESKGVVRTLREHLDRSPDREIVVLPQSYKFETVDFASFFRGRSAPTTLFTRERYSLAFLESAGVSAEVRIGLDHDMAFRLADSRFLADTSSRLSADHVLVVERADVEGTTGAQVKPIGSPAVNRFVPEAVKAPLRRVISRRRAQAWSSQSPFVSSMRERLIERVPEAAGLPTVALDISDRNNTDFDGFVSAIAGAAAVATNRLHVGVLAGLLGKPTLLASNSYHKIMGIREMSMTDMPHVEFLG
ncbi:MAG: polysaccharide pyruvyl transferase family protein [Planctomycetota bacterium]